MNENDRIDDVEMVADTTENTESIDQEIGSEMNKKEKIDKVIGNEGETIELENWRGWTADDKKAKHKKKAKRSSTSILNSHQETSKPITILKNGGTSQQTKTCPKIISTETCGFDSIFEVVAAGIL